MFKCFLGFNAGDEIGAPELPETNAANAKRGGYPGGADFFNAYPAEHILAAVHGFAGLNMPPPHFGGNIYNRLDPVMPDYPHPFFDLAAAAPRRRHLRMPDAGAPAVDPAAVRARLPANKRRKVAETPAVAETLPAYQPLEPFLGNAVRAGERAPAAAAAAGPAEAAANEAPDNIEANNAPQAVANPDVLLDPADRAVKRSEAAPPLVHTSVNITNTIARPAALDRERALPKRRTYNYPAGVDARRVELTSLAARKRPIDEAMHRALYGKGEKIVNILFHVYSCLFIYFEVAK